MPFKPNYRQQRAERDRAKERKAEEKRRRREEEALRRAPAQEAEPAPPDYVTGSTSSTG